MTDLLGRTLGEPISVQTVPGAGLWHVKADPGPLENAILNLCVNARDAMPKGGKLTIETSNAFVDDRNEAAADPRHLARWVRPRVAARKLNNAVRQLPNEQLLGGSGRASIVAGLAALSVLPVPRRLPRRS